MYRKLIVSTFFALGLLVFAASAQQPSQPPPKAKEAVVTSPQPGLPGKGGGGGTKQTDPADALVHAALANDPDVKVAQAKIQLAEAEMAKAKQAVVLKVLTLNATIQELKGQVAVHTRKLETMQSLVKAAAIPQEEVDLERSKLESAKSALAKAEMELKLITGGMHKEVGAISGFRDATLSNDPAAAEAALKWFAQSMKEKQVTKGPIPDRIRAALDKPVKLGSKGEQVTFDKALEVFKKDAGLDVPVRNYGLKLEITSEGEELPVGAWFQLFSDNNGCSFSVREYGLLVTAKGAAPDAITVMELWKPPVKKGGEPILRKYSVPAGTAEAIAKALSQNEPSLRILALPTTNEIIVLATEAEHTIFMGKVKDIGGGEKPEPKSQTDPAKR
ncbi:MAG TPA: hypothetical protein VG122_18925 [Gemmata sp.]|jgi:hypothetical protein|nr:hypothetical protein [Gemmata sp.]